MLFYCLLKFPPVYLNLVRKLTNQRSINIWERRPNSSDKKKFLGKKPFNKLFSVSFRGKNKLSNDATLSTLLKEEVTKI